jgi:type I restriction enzyme M protein
MRVKMIKDDQVECVIGLGPNLFYNSPMESCLLITKKNKSPKRKKKILIINAVNEVKQLRNISFLEEKNIQKIFKAYKDFKDIKNFSKIISCNDVLINKGSLNIAQYVSNIDANITKTSLTSALVDLKENSKKMKINMSKIL